MDEINAIVKSESLSSYLSCYSNEDERTKIFTNTKSRLIVHYNDGSTYKENARKLYSHKNYYQSGSSTTKLRELQQQTILEHHHRVQIDSDDELPSSYNRPFDIERFRRHSSREVTSSNVKRRGRTNTELKYPIDWRSSHPEKTFVNKSNTPSNENYPEISSFNESASWPNVKRKSFVHYHSITQQNNETETVDSPSGTPLQSGTITTVDVCKTEKELLRTWNNNDLLNQLKGEQSSYHSEHIPLNKIPNESKSSTLNNERSELNIEFQSMKQTLRNSSSAIKKFDLIQSLVLRLSNQEPIERLATVQAIVNNDFFDLKDESNNILEDLLWPANITTPHPLQTATAKLLNALVSFEIGRDYFNGISMVKLLTWSRSEHIYDSMADNLIAALKKLSLNKFQRQDMLEKGLLQWLINHMEEVECSASMFHLECMTDLLRMLMNVENSTEYSFVNVPHLIIVLVRYLNNPNEYVQVNISHVLRTLFLNEAAVEIGNKINLHRIIRDHIENASNSKLRADLQFIYDLFIEYRTSNSNKLESYAVSVSSHFGSPEKTTCLEHREEKQYKAEKNEQFICERNLIAENNEKDDMQLSEKSSQSSPFDLRSYILKLCLDEKLTKTNTIKHSTSDDGQDNQSDMVRTGTRTEVIYSNLNSRLDQSSSLLSSGSQCASNECKENAIQTIKMQSTHIDVAFDIDNVNQDLSNTSTSKLKSQRMEEPTIKVSTDYADLNSIAKDPNARKEILENDSFIDELCEKVLIKLKSKLQSNLFCGTNCNTGQADCSC